LSDTQHVVLTGVNCEVYCQSAVVYSGTIDKLQEAMPSVFNILVAAKAIRPAHTTASLTPSRPPARKPARKATLRVVPKPGPLKMEALSAGWSDTHHEYILEVLIAGNTWLIVTDEPTCIAFNKMGVPS
jgi:hypothetical protein